jgi:hypothetical protein
MKTVLFFDSNLNERGTSVSTYDYAHFNETILGNKSIIASFKTGELTTYNKAKNRFNKVHLIDNIKDLEKIKCDYVYNQKFGFNDGNVVSTAKNLIHAVFPSYQPHGEVYAYISKWLANNIQEGKIKCEFTPTPNPSDIKEKIQYVSYMINLPDIQSDYKEYFNIKKENLVIGWYGGINSFDGELNIARQVVIDVAKKRKDIKSKNKNYAYKFCILFQLTTKYNSKTKNENKKNENTKSRNYKKTKRENEKENLR